MPLQEGHKGLTAQVEDASSQAQRVPLRVYERFSGLKAIHDQPAAAPQWSQGQYQQRNRCSSCCSITNSEFLTLYRFKCRDKTNN